MSTKIIIIVGIVLILIAVLSSVKKNSGARFISTKLGVPAGIIGVLLIIYASYSSDLVNYNRQIEQISIGIKNWKRDKDYKTYNLIRFKIKNGKIEEIF